MKKPLKDCFDDLQKAAQSTVSLLKDRQDGLMVWNKMLKENGYELIKCLQNLGYPIKLDV